MDVGRGNIKGPDRLLFINPGLGGLASRKAYLDSTMRCAIAP